MRTFEYRLYPNQEQHRRLMACLIESRKLYNEMLQASKEHYEQTGTFLLKYDLTARFKGRGGEYVPASTVQQERHARPPPPGAARYVARRPEKRR